jgi:hypothetical protein
VVYASPILRVHPATQPQPALYPISRPPYTGFVNQSFIPFRLTRVFLALFLFVPCLSLPSHAQEPTPVPAAPQAAKPSEKPADKLPAPREAPAQIELLETRIRFEANGDSRKEVHTRAHINNELGVRQFAHIGFGYNRSFEQIEISAVHIIHATGGSADILPSAASDQPNPAVVEAPAYQDVRIKSVRILGLAPGDTLEYRVVTTVSHHPLAPQFWLDHSFSRGGIVTQELFELSVPPSRKVRLYTSPGTPAATIDESGDGPNPSVIYRWQVSSNSKSEHAGETPSSEPDVVLTTYESWQQLCKNRLVEFFGTTLATPPEIEAKASALAPATATTQARIEAIYDFVSQKIRIIDLPLGATGFHTRNPVEILSSGYASPEDKFALFASLVHSPIAIAGLVSDERLTATAGFARPSAFDHLLAMVSLPGFVRWLDLSMGVAPFGVIPSRFRGQRALMIRLTTEEPWRSIPRTLPFVATQKVNVAASLASDGTLTAKVHYAMRGDNELLLRLAFHESPREKWKDVAQLLALSDGFRGKITSASASDPYSTKHPFTVEYEITQPKFVDWSKKPVRLPALLPALGLPDPPTKSEDRESSSPIDLGTPLNVDTKLTLRLPPGVSAEGPTGTSVERDYATFSSHYAAEGNVIFASRQINFLHRQVPATRAADYNAFLHAVQTDQAQLFTLTHLETLSQPHPPKVATPDPPKP